MNNVVKMKNMSRRRFFKRAARNMLFSDWVCQIFAFIVVGAFFIGVNHFGTSAALIVGELTQNIYLTGFVVCFFAFVALAMVIPLLYGLVCFEINAVSNQKGVLSDLFCAFSSGEKLMRSYSMFFGVFFRCVLWYLPAIAVYCFRTFVYEKGMLLSLSLGGIDVVYFLLNTLLVITLYLGFTLSIGVIVGIYLTVKMEDKRVEECFFLAKIVLYKNRFELSKLALSFLPIFVLSLFSIGFLFVMYTAPYMMIAFVMFSKYLHEKYNLAHNPENLYVNQ